MSGGGRSSESFMAGVTIFIISGFILYNKLLFTVSPTWLLYWPCLLRACVYCVLLCTCACQKSPLSFYHGVFRDWTHQNLVATPLFTNWDILLACICLLWRWLRVIKLETCKKTMVNAFPCFIILFVFFFKAGMCCVALACLVLIICNLGWFQTLNLSPASTSQILEL